MIQKTPRAPHHMTRALIALLFGSLFGVGCGLDNDVSPRVSVCLPGYTCASTEPDMSASPDQGDASLDMGASLDMNAADMAFDPLGDMAACPAGTLMCGGVCATCPADAPAVMCAEQACVRVACEVSRGEVACAQGCCASGPPPERAPLPLPPGVGTPALAMDGRDRAHVFDLDRARHVGWYAHWNGAQWTHQAALQDPEGRLEHARILLDRQEHPHLLTVQRAPDRLLHAWRDAANVWQTEVIHEASVFEEIQAFDARVSAGGLHIAIITHADTPDRGDTDTLRLFTSYGSRWSVSQPLALGGEHCETVALALDGNSTEHVVAECAVERPRLVEHTLQHFMRIDGGPVVATGLIALESAGRGLAMGIDQYNALVIARTAPDGSLAVTRHGLELPIADIYSPSRATNATMQAMGLRIAPRDGLHLLHAHEATDTTPDETFLLQRTAGQWNAPRRICAGTDATLHASADGSAHTLHRAMDGTLRYTGPGALKTN